jgi:hypothetical protein
MLDSVMLGRIENSYYALAKEFGVVSNEINELNQLFAQLVDRKPAAIESFETLCMKAYNPQHATNNSPNTNESLWEKMLNKQKQLVSKMKQYGSTTHNDYITFNKILHQLCNQEYFNQRIAEIQFHFDSCLHRKKASMTLQIFQSTTKSGDNLCNSIYESKETHMDITYNQFINKMKNIADEAKAKLSKQLIALQAEQLAHTKVMHHQKSLHQYLVIRCQRGEIQSIDEEIELCRQLHTDLGTKLDISKLNLLEHKKDLLQNKVSARYLLPIAVVNNSTNIQNLL